MMGVGYHTCEKLIYDSDGTMLTDRSWDYHLGGPRDIPQKFYITLKHNYSNDLIYGSKGKSVKDCDTVMHEINTDIIHPTNCLITIRFFLLRKIILI